MKWNINLLNVLKTRTKVIWKKVKKMEENNNITFDHMQKYMRLLSSTHSHNQPPADVAQETIPASVYGSIKSENMRLLGNNRHCAEMVSVLPTFLQWCLLMVLRVISITAQNWVKDCFIRLKYFLENRRGQQTVRAFFSVSVSV